MIVRYEGAKSYTCPGTIVAIEFLANVANFLSETGRESLFLTNHR